MRVDLTQTRIRAQQTAGEWGLELGEPFALSRHSVVAPVSDDAVFKLAWEEDDESLHEAEALELWDGEGAVRLLRRSGRALLEERARPGTDLSDLDDDAAMDVAVAVGGKLWRRAGRPFRPVVEHVPGWLDNAQRREEPAYAVLGAIARELLPQLGGDWLVHGDFHHHNVLRHGGGHVAIDPKPYLADREYDVYTWLHNPLSYELTDLERTERRMAHFVAAGLDEWRIRAWAVVRGAYLIGDEAPARVLRSLI